MASIVKQAKYCMLLGKWGTLRGQVQSFRRFSVCTGSFSGELSTTMKCGCSLRCTVLYKVFFTIFYYCPFEIRQTSYFCPIYPIFQPMCIFLHISFCTLNSVTIVMIVKWSLITFLFRIVCRISCALISSLIEMLRPMLSTQAQQGIHIIVV